MQAAPGYITMSSTFRSSSSSSSSSLLIISCSIMCLLASALGAALQHQQQQPKFIHPLQLRIAQCRQRCYGQALLQHTPHSLCRATPDCYMCHDYCRVLAIADWSLASSMCADRVFCSHGCRIACHYHEYRTAVNPLWTANSLSKLDVP